jgi:hypothetical protein
MGKQKKIGNIFCFVEREYLGTKSPTLHSAGLEKNN